MPVNERDNQILEKILKYGTQDLMDFCQQELSKVPELTEDL